MRHERACFDCSGATFLMTRCFPIDNTVLCLVQRGTRHSSSHRKRKSSVCTAKAARRHGGTAARRHGGKARHCCQCAPYSYKCNFQTSRHTVPAAGGASPGGGGRGAPARATLGRAKLAGGEDNAASSLTLAYSSSIRFSQTAISK